LVQDRGRGRWRCAPFEVWWGFACRAYVGGPEVAGARPRSAPCVTPRGAFHTSAPPRPSRQHRVTGRSGGCQRRPAATLPYYHGFGLEEMVFCLFPHQKDTARHAAAAEVNGQAARGSSSRPGASLRSSWAPTPNPQAWQSVANAKNTVCPYNIQRALCVPADPRPRPQQGLSRAHHPRTITSS